MAKVSIKAGTTSYLARIFIQDSSSATGAGLSGLTNASSGLICYAARDDDGNAGGTVISLSAGTRGTWSSGGFVEKDSTHMKGVYEFGIPNATIAAGSKSVLIYFSGATNMAPLPLEIELTAVDNQDATAFGVSRIDAAISSRMATFTLPTNFSSLVIDGSGRIDLSKVGGAAINALIAGRLDVDLTFGLETKTYGEPSAAIGATVALKDMINWLKCLARNKITQTSTTTLLRNDADAATIGTSTISDDGTTFTRNKFS